MRDSRPYPSDNVVDFENYVQENYNGVSDRKLLPVTWTSYYRKADYGRNKVMMQQLQDYLNTLKGKFFTVCQYDDGILSDISHLDCQVFGMGKKIGYPLPLISQRHSFEFRDRKNIPCSFIGNPTHEIRREIFKLKERNWILTARSFKLQEYCKLLHRSVFGLCPRGYGITSFRIAECLQYGAIPVYVSDEFIIPHNIDFESYGVLVDSKEVKNLGKIIKSIPSRKIVELQSNIRYVYVNYYTYAANLKIIQSSIK
jgi:hypothetical protein